MATHKGAGEKQGTTDRGAHQQGGGGHGTTPSARATAAAHLADQVAALYGKIVGETALLGAAATAGDHAGYLKSRKQADADLGELELLAPRAQQSVGDASDTDKPRLQNAQALLAAATAMLQSAPAAPGKPAPALASADLLAAALPPDAPVQDAAQKYAVAEAAVATIFKSQMVFSDIVAFQAMLRDHPEHTFVRRFHRFALARQTKLLAILADGNVRGRARALEDAKKKAAAAAPVPVPMLVVPGDFMFVTDGPLIMPIDAPPQHGPVEVRLDKSKDGQRMYALLHDRGFLGLGPDHQAEIVAILEANSAPEDMHALAVAAGGWLADGVRRAVTNPSLRARAFVYLGELMDISTRVDEHGKNDAAAIMAELDRLTDPQALAMVEGGTRADTVTAQHPHWLPSATNLPELQTALRDKLADDDYYRAMREILAKADRASAARAKQQPPLVIAEVGKEPIGIIGVGTLSAASKVRVELAEQRIRSQDAKGDWSTDGMLEGPAYLALTDLEADERAELAQRLEDKALKNGLGGMSIIQLARNPDDATVIETALRESHGRAQSLQKTANAEGTSVALARGGELMANARAKLEKLPKDAPAAEHDAAAAEVARLEKLFLADDATLRTTLRYEQARGGDPDGDELCARLTALGADPATVAAERLRHVTKAPDGESVGKALRKIPAPERAFALERSGLSADYYFWKELTPAGRSYLQAITMQAGTALPLTLVLATDQQPTVEPVMMVTSAAMPPAALGYPDAAGFDPELEIAKHDVLAEMAKPDADRAFTMIARLTDRLAKAMFDDPDYQAAFAKLPDGAGKTHLIDASVYGPKRVLADQGSLASARETPGIALDALAQRADFRGQAMMRRARVLVERAGGVEAVAKNPSLVDQLSPTIDERVAIHELVAGVDAGKRFDPAMVDVRDSMTKADDRESANQIMFGQPQLTDSPEGVADANTEAEFMHIRLREAAGVRSGSEVMDHFTDAGPNMDAAVAEFETLYRTLQPGGFQKQDLPALAEKYHRALRSLDAYRAANESFASTAAQVVGAVVATIAVTVLSGGTLGPAAIGAVAGLSAGAAQAATGAVLRLESTHGSILRDFGTGAVQGAVSGLAGPLAARVVRGASMGIAGGRAAATAGGIALDGVAGGLGSHVAVAAIEGAIGNSAAELFATATDEATWDRGIAEALATMLAALGRGALVGAAMGGGTILVGAGLAAVGRGIGHVAERTAQMWEGTVGRQVLEKLTEEEAAHLERVYASIKLRRFDEAQAQLSHIGSIEKPTQALMIETARARVAMEAVADLPAVDWKGVTLQPRQVSTKEFAALAHGGNADAAVIIEHGEPQIIVREGASPNAIREEVTHLHQFQSDVLARERMLRLSEETFKNYRTKTPDEKLGLHLDKLEVEHAGQMQIIDQLAASDATDAALQIDDAQETLFLLEERIDKLRKAATTGHIDVVALKLDEEPRLFSKGVVSQPKKSLSRANQKAYKQATKLVGKDARKITDEEWDELGYVPHRRDGKGPVFRVTRKPDLMSDRRPHLTIRPDHVIEEGEGRVDFEARMSSAGRSYESETTELKKLAKQVDAGKGDVELTERVDKGALKFRGELEHHFADDHAAAGILAPWGQICEELEEACRKTGGRVQFTMRGAIENLPKPLKEGAYNEFRREVRRTTLALVTQVEDDARRMSKLHYWLDRQPDPGSKGELFTQYREWDMGKEGTGTIEGFELGSQPKPFTGADLDKTRTPDGRATVSTVSRGERNIIPTGETAIEDKAGPGAFKIEQARDYARRARPTEGFGLTKRAKDMEYDNLLYVFDTREHAEAAMILMKDDELVLGRLDENPGGIFVSYYENGELQRMNAGKVKGKKS